jgi:predicted SAM-dependent methyltransferase
MSLKQRMGNWMIPRLPLSRFAFDLLRGELNAASNRLAWRLLPHLWIRRRRLRNLRGIYVNVGSGGFLLPGFVHVDLFGGGPAVVRWDCTSRLPFGDGAARGIRMEHFLEHVEPRQQLPSLLADCHRILEPGGILRVVVPDAGRFLQAYCAGDDAAFAELGFAQPFPADLPTRMDVVSHIFHQWHEHRWGYDFETLAARLRTAGFESIVQQGFGESSDPHMAADREQHKAYSLYVDAIK